MSLKTERQAADMLAITVWSLAQYTAAGMPFTVKSGVKLYDVKKCLAWLKAGTFNKC